jgi:hypothetical protein
MRVDVAIEILELFRDRFEAVQDLIGGCRVGHASASSVQTVLPEDAS